MRRLSSNRTNCLTSLLLAAACLPSAAVHAAVGLVLDINQTPGSTPGTTADSNPSDFVDFAGHLVFVADDGVHGRELWQSDGTAAGTRMIADLAPGAASSTPNQLVVANGLLYFFAADAAGVSHLMVLAPGSTTPTSLAQLTPSQSCTVAAGPAVMHGKLILSASDATGTHIWETDGTAAGTAPFDTPANPSILNPRPLAVVNDTLYVAGLTLQPHVQAIWSTAGTWADVRELAVMDFDQQIGSYITEFSGAIYFNVSMPGTPQELSTNGIYRAGETQFGAPAESILVGSVFDSNGHVPRILGISNGRLVAENITVQPPKEVTVALGFSSDGVNFNWLPNQVVGPTLVNGGLTFATVSNSPGTVGALLNPFVTDGTAGGSSRLVTIGQSGVAGFDWFADYHGTTLFSVNDPTLGHQLWRTDGSSVKTALVASLPAAPKLPGVGGTNFFFVTQDPTAGNELFVFTGGPVAADVTGTSSGGVPVNLAVLSNAYDSGGSLDTSSVKVASPPSHGTATVGTDGVITYTPNTGYSGTDTFTYTVADTRGTLSAAGNVSVTVTAPVAAPTKSGGGAIQATDLLVLFAVLSLVTCRSQRTRRSVSNRPG